jgi:hypothetical protein
MSKPDKEPRAEVKNKDTVITRDDLIAFIKTQDDFALELYAYSLASSKGFKVSHAGSYVDPVTGKTRQYDVRANRDCGNNFHTYFAIECKALRPSFPVLVSQISRSKAESYQTVIHTAGMIDFPPYNQNIMGPNTQRLEGSASIYPAGVYVGKAIVQVGYGEKGSFHSNNNEVFEKWGQAIASANGQIRDAARLNDSSDRPSQSAIVIPVLVVPDGTLWVTGYGEDGELQNGPVQKNSVEIYIGDLQTTHYNHTVEYAISHLHIVTRHGLEQFLGRFSHPGDDIKKFVKGSKD